LDGSFYRVCKSFEECSRPILGVDEQLLNHFRGCFTSISLSASIADVFGSSRLVLCLAAAV
jgi:hypothetical protein